MLEAAGILGADASDPLCNKFIADMIDSQSEVVAFIRGLAPLRDQAQQLSAYLQTANAAGQLAPLGENVNGILQFFEALDLYPYYEKSFAPVSEPMVVPAQKRGGRVVTV